MQYYLQWIWFTVLVLFKSITLSFFNHFNIGFKFDVATVKISVALLELHWNSK